MDVEKVTDTSNVVGESPVWDPDTKKVVWTDIETGQLFAYDPELGATEQIYQGLNVGAIARNKRGGYVLFSWDGVFLWNPNGTPLRYTPNVVSGHMLRFNEAIGEPNGGAFAGTYIDEQTSGVLVRIDTGGRVSIVAEGIGCANGMGFSPDLHTFYQTDSETRTIYAYDYDARSGRIANKRSLVVLDSSDGVPDGMTVDRDGFLWSALWFAGCIIRVDPDGVEERRIQIPATQPSCVAFGGNALDELYVTTASSLQHQGSKLDPRNYDWAKYESSYRGGALCRLRPGVRGREEYCVDFDPGDATMTNAT
jgi:D-xylono/L-arabinono-1,4-lactonase